MQYVASGTWHDSVARTIGIGNMAYFLRHFHGWNTSWYFLQAYCLSTGKIALPSQFCLDFQA